MFTGLLPVVQHLHYQQQVCVWVLCITLLVQPTAVLVQHDHNWKRSNKAFTIVVRVKLYREYATQHQNCRCYPMFRMTTVLRGFCQLMQLQVLAHNNGLRLYNTTSQLVLSVKSKASTQLCYCCENVILF